MLAEREWISSTYYTCRMLATEGRIVSVAYARNTTWVLLATVAALSLAWSGADAEASIMFEGSSGSLSASVEFDLSGSSLTAVLTNISLVDVIAPADVLCAVFFDIQGDPTLTRVSAVLTAGATVFFGGTDPGNVVGGEWAYNWGLSGAPGGADQGISSVGLDLFGPPDLFPGTNLSGPGSPDGLQYGITSAGDNSATGNTPVTGGYELIHNSVTFTFTSPDGFVLEDISNVYFQYGTSLDEPSFPSYPEPGSLLLLISGVAAVWVGASRRRR